VLVKGKGSPYSITERRVPELITVLGSQPAGDVSHKPGGRLPYFPPSLQLTPQPLIGMLPSLLFGEQRHDGCEQFAQDCYQTASRLQFEPRPSAPESSTLTTRLSSHPCSSVDNILLRLFCDPRLLRPGQLPRPLFTPMSENPIKCVHAVSRRRTHNAALSS